MYIYTLDLPIHHVMSYLDKFGVYDILNPLYPVILQGSTDHIFWRDAPGQLWRQTHCQRHAGTGPCRVRLHLACRGFRHTELR